MSEREFGPQRKRATDGRALHCCCICLKLEPWGPTWSYYASLKEEDDCTPFPKFCSEVCVEKGGPNTRDVTATMKETAKEMEWRDPKPYQPPPQPRGYNDAAHEQRRERERQARLAAFRNERASKPPAT
jgi:hypothetical protein